MDKQLIETLTKERLFLSEVENTLNKIPVPSRYMSLAKTSLELGRMYLGEICHDLGHKYPYEKTKDATKASEIQPAADVSSNSIKLGDNNIQNIITIRAVLDSSINNVINPIIKYRRDNRITDNVLRFRNNCNISEAYRSLKESRMWLGKLLGEIRDKELSQSNG